MTEGEEPELLTVLAASGQIFYRSDWTDNGDSVSYTHLTIAGAQLENVTVEEAREQVKAVIREMLEKGDIS